MDAPYTAGQDDCRLEIGMLPAGCNSVRILRGSRLFSAQALLRRHRLAVHRPEPAHLKKPRDSFRITTIRLDRHRLQRTLNLAVSINTASSPASVSPCV